MCLGRFGSGPEPNLPKHTELLVLVWKLCIFGEPGSEPKKSGSQKTKKCEGKGEKRKERGRRRKKRR